MSRYYSLAVLALPLVACGLDARDLVSREEPVPTAAEAPDEVASASADGDDRSATPALPAAPSAPLCDASGPYVAAPEGTPACSFDAVCDVDADCAAHAGTYCKPDLCASAGCLRGGCVLTKVQGQACVRDGECVSQKCECAGEQCACGAEEDLGGFHFP